MDLGRDPLAQTRRPILLYAGILYLGGPSAGTIDPNSASGKFFGGIGTSRTLGKVDQFLGLETNGSRLAKSFDELDKATKGYNDRLAKEAKEEPQRALPVPKELTIPASKMPENIQ